MCIIYVYGASFELWKGLCISSEDVTRIITFASEESEGIRTVTLYRECTRFSLGQWDGTCRIMLCVDESFKNVILLLVMGNLQSIKISFLWEVTVLSCVDTYQCWDACHSICKPMLSREIKYMIYALLTPIKSWRLWLTAFLWRLFWNTIGPSSTRSFHGDSWHVTQPNTPNITSTVS